MPKKKKVKKAKKIKLRKKPKLPLKIVEKKAVDIRMIFVVRKN